jgi:hypothetical protein
VRLVAAVLGANLVLTAVGFCVLAGALRGRPWREWPSYSGVALLAGVGAVGVAAHAAVAAGVRASLPAFAVAAAGVGAAGLVAAQAGRRWWQAPGSPPRHVPGFSRSLAVRSIEILLAACLLTLLALAAVAAFRTGPWLDDTWTMWVPKGLALEAFGLDPRLFAPSAGYGSFAHLDYPLWWSLVTGLDMRLVGHVDMRVATAQTGLLVFAFFAAAARLLWGSVRAWVLWLGLLLLAASPELLRQTQSGGADLPLAVYLALFVLCSAAWLATGERLALVLASLFAAVCLLIKSEGAPQVLLFALVITLVALTQGTARLRQLWLAVGAALLAATPWLVWRQVHGIRTLSDINLADATNPGYLLDRTDRVGPAAERLLFHITNPREWLVVVPLVVVLGAVAALRSRRLLWLAPAAGLVAGYAFWVWVNWADPLDLEYRLGTSSYRVIDGLVLAAGLALPVVAEGALASRSRRRAAATEGGLVAGGPAPSTPSPAPVIAHQGRG